MSLQAFFLPNSSVMNTSSCALRQSRLAARVLVRLFWDGTRHQFSVVLPASHPRLRHTATVPLVFFC